MIKKFLLALPVILMLIGSKLMNKLFCMVLFKQIFDQSDIFLLSLSFPFTPALFPGFELVFFFPFQCTQIFLGLVIAF